MTVYPQISFEAGMALYPFGLQLFRGGFSTVHGINVTTDRLLADFTYPYSSKRMLALSADGERLCLAAARPVLPAEASRRCLAILAAG